MAHKLNLNLSSVQNRIGNQLNHAGLTIYLKCDKVSMKLNNFYLAWNKCNRDLKSLLRMTYKDTQNKSDKEIRNPKQTGKKSKRNEFLYVETSDPN